MEILVTGGIGYIGSHTCVELLNNNHSVIIADNLINSKIETLDKIKQITNKDLMFYQIDVTDEQAVEFIFLSYKIDNVIHFAGLKAVDESVEKSLQYYYNNIVSTMVLTNACIKHNVSRFVFNSSAAVYGENIETMDLLPTTNLIAKSNLWVRGLNVVAKANPGLSVILLRYFKP